MHKNTDKTDKFTVIIPFYLHNSLLEKSKPVTYERKEVKWSKAFV